MHAQISEGGIPPSYSSPVSKASARATKQLDIKFDLTAMRVEDEQQSAQFGVAPVIGTVIEVDYDTQNAGEWRTLPSGETVWNLTLGASGATALMLYYSDFYIPEGGKLFIYNADKSSLLGAYTTATHRGGGRFATEFVAGDELTLEYVEAPSGEQPRIVIEGVGYGYNNLVVRDGQVSLRASSCEVNVNCPEGDAWQNQKKGVCRMVQRIGTKEYLCSASLMNNTAQDLKPYILTAHHCSLASDGTEANAEDMLQWTFYFHYELEGCSGKPVPSVEQKTMVGCRKVAVSNISGQSDGLLLLLNSYIPEEYNVYYNGWDTRDVPAQSGVSIHFPGGDYASISTFLSPVSHTTLMTDDNMNGDTHAHWNAVFDPTENGHGITESGSSGSPLFNENKLIVGTLSGGSSTCYSPYLLNLYGKMSYHWNHYPKADSTRMDVWLDPHNTGVQALTGRFAGKTLAAPTALSAVQESNKVRLTWSKPASSTPMGGYFVYRNNRRIGTTLYLTYTDSTPEVGTNNYSVSAVYANDNESEFATTAITIEEYKPPTDISAVFTTTGKVSVTWQPPVYEKTIYWGQKNAYVQIVMDDDVHGNPKPFFFGQRWAKEDIAPFHLRTITAVKFMPVQRNTYSLYIEQGKRSYTQPITVQSYRETNTVALATPFVIDGTSELKVTLYVESPRDYPAWCDAGPAVQGKGNIYSYDGKTWDTLYDPEDPDEDFNLNFFIAAVVSSNTGELTSSYSSTTDSDIKLLSLVPVAFPEVTGYYIYRNNEKITKTPVSAGTRRYTDPNDITSATEYSVTAQYGSNESDFSATVEIVPTANEQIAASRIAIEPTVFTNTLNIRGNEAVRRIEIFAADGRLVLSRDNPDNVIATQQLAAGVYFFRIYPIEGQPIMLKGVKSR
jgi:hypothetical protein